jgi:hypothetical protein
LRGGQNKVFVLLEERLKSPPELAVCDLGVRDIRASQPQSFFDLAFERVLMRFTPL